MLLHYRPDSFGKGFVSDADDARFFLASSGKTDPHAELAATLAAFFSAEAVGAEPQPAQCAFVARYAWLRRELALDDARLPRQPCEAYSRWIAGVDADAATLVFTSAYLNNPASLFGHSLLRLDRRGQTESTRLLAYAVSYAADERGSKGLMYAIDGISGGFAGFFDLQPYDRLVRSYSDRENRDIWEYRLTLSPAAMQRLLAHIWELRGVKFDYYFFRQNCAWQLLTLLEAADPARHLSDQFLLWVPPPDTVHLIAAEPGLVAAVTPRPARGSSIRRRYEALDADERRLARALRDSPASAALPAFSALAPARQALLLELAYDEAQSRHADEASPAGQTDAYSLLAARSRLPAASPVAIEPYAGRPEAGHGSHRVGVALGRPVGGSEPAGFIDLDARASFHDFLEPDAGYAPDAAIEILSATVRHRPALERTRLNALTLIDMGALQPFSALIPRPAWHAFAGWTPAPRPGCGECTAFRMDAQLGGALETRWPWRSLWSVLPGLALEHGVGSQGQDRGGAGLKLGLVSEPAAGWKLAANIERSAFRVGASTMQTRWTLAQHLALSRDLALRAACRQQGGARECSVGLLAYF